MKTIAVIGLDGTGCPMPEAEPVLRQAAAILASPRLHELFSASPLYREVKERVQAVPTVEETLAQVRRAPGAVAVLASGDPLFFGIGRRVAAEADGPVAIYPALSSIQQAFARLGLAWDDALLVSLHGGLLRDWGLADLPLLCEHHPKVAILTGGENTAAAVLARLPPAAEAHVAEGLGGPGERVRSGPPAALRKLRFREPNLVISLNPGPGGPVLGLREEDFAHARGLITKDEVRAVVLHKLALPKRGVLWDVGAGSGSVSVEAKRLSPLLKVYAVEADPARAAMAAANFETFHAGGVRLIRGRAPEALAGLPAPDRVFVGGSGGSLDAIIGHVSRVMSQGLLVLSLVTLEGLAAADQALSREGFRTETAAVSISRAEPVGDKRYLKAQNTVFVVRGVR